MELVQGFTRRQETEKVASTGGLAGWVVGALQGRVRIKWCSLGRSHVQQMRLLETLPLGGRRQVMLVACAGERYLVGCGADTVATIVKVSAAVESQPAIKTVAQAWL